MNPRSFTRRNLLKRSALAASALGFPAIVPASALGAEGNTPANSRINLAFIGTGRQVFYANLPMYLWHKEVQVVAACDADNWRLQQARAKVEENYAQKHIAYKGCDTCRDFREVLARKDIDAVMISTPDHWHAYMAVEAAKAGKDIALEKPISLTVKQGRAIAEAVKKHNRIFRTDSEVRFAKPFHQLCTVVRNGLIGKVQRVLASVPKDPPPLTENPPAMPVPEELDYTMWQGPAPQRPYTEMRVHPRKAGLDYSGKPVGWFRIRDYGLGVILNWGTHILDIVQWALNTERTGPAEVEGKGEFPANSSMWDVLQKFEVTYRYPSGVEVVYTNGGVPSVRIEGTDGWIENTWFKSDGFKASKPELLKWKPGASDVTLPWIDEKQDFVNCVLSRKETVVPAEVGHRAATMCQIGHIAIEVGGKLKWDPASETFSNSDAANKLLSRAEREPWKVSV